MQYIPILLYFNRQGPILPGLTPNGRRVCVLRGVSKEISTPNIDDCMKLVLMAGDIRLKEEQVGVAGDVYIFDATVATPGHFAKVSPTMVKKFLICVQVCYYVIRFVIDSYRSLKLIFTLHRKLIQ